MIGQENHEYSKVTHINKIKISEYRNYKDKLEMALFIRVTPKACVSNMGHPSSLYTTSVVIVSRDDPCACGSPLPSISEKGTSCEYEYAHLHSISLTINKV